MPVKRGLVAPQNIFIQTILKKFDNSPDRNFVLGNAQVNSVPIIYSNEGFCRLTGYSRAELMQKHCSCDFLCGEETNNVSARAVKAALRGSEEKKIEIVYYKKDGTKFICSVVIAPVKSENGEVVMYIVNHEDVTGSPDRSEVDHHALKSGCLPRKKNSSRLVFKSNKLKPTRGRPSLLARKSSKKNSTEGENCETPNSIPLLNILPPSPPELSVVEEKEEDQDDEQTTKEPLRPISSPIKSSSLSDLVSGLKRFGSDNVLHRSYSLLGASSPRERTEECHLSVNSHLSSANSRSDSNLWNTRVERDQGMWSSTLELPRGSSLKIANALPLPQNSLVPGKTEKVAQVMSLGADVLPEYKLQSPKIHPWTILHYSPFKAFWDWLVLFLVIYTAIVTPYMASFVLSRDRKREILNQDAETRRNYGPLTVYSDPLVIVDYIVDVMFIVDIFINFRTTFVDSHDEVVSNPCRIAVHYVKTWFAVDFVAAIPFELLIMIEKTDQATTLIGLLKTARLLRLVRVARKLDQYSEYGMAVLCLLMCSFALLAHWLACIWYAIANIERSSKSANKNIGWLDSLAEQTNQPYNDSDINSGPDLESKYVTALYFTLSSLTSVGFGNVSPNTNAEKIFSICVMLIGSLFYAAIFGNVAAIIARLYSSTARYHSQMKKVREFIRFHQIPNPLRQRIEDYAHHMWSYTNGFDMDQVMKGFPECLQADICLHLNANILCTMKVFQSASMGCLRALALRLTSTHLPPGDYIVYQGDEVNHLFFIMRGTVEIVKDDVIMAILGKGDTFGENFSEDLTRPTGTANASVRALTYCDLHSIKKEDLLYIVRQYPMFMSAMNNDLDITYNLRNECKEKRPEYNVLDVQRHSNYSGDSSFSELDNKTTKSLIQRDNPQIFLASDTPQEQHNNGDESFKPSISNVPDLQIPQEACVAPDSMIKSNDRFHFASSPGDKLNSSESESSRTDKENSEAAACKSCCHTLKRVECRVEGISSRLEQLETRLTSDFGELLELLRVFKQDASDRLQVDSSRDTSQTSHARTKLGKAHTFV